MRKLSDSAAAAWIHLRNFWCKESRWSIRPEGCGARAGLGAAGGSAREPGSGGGRVAPAELGWSGEEPGRDGVGLGGQGLGVAGSGRRLLGGRVERQSEIELKQFF